MSYLLVTNDDGVDSPSLVPFMRELRRLAPVRAIVPDRERSWIGKAITRFDEVSVERADRDGFEIHAAAGFPADCVQIGAHALFPEPPEMVVSGINLGLNHGRAFLLSSGTVGAAIEGSIAGFPAVAFSTGDVHNHAGWSRFAWTASADELWDRAAAVAVDILDSIRTAGFPAGADVVSVNFPHQADVETPRAVTTIAPTGYDNVFSELSPGRFVHDFGQGLRIRGSLAHTEVEALERGHVAITPISLAEPAPVAESFRNAVAPAR